MDASDGATNNGSGSIVPDPVSLPSAVVPVGGPVSSSEASPGAAEKPAGPPADPKRDERGRFGKKNNANPRGNYKHTPNLNSQLIKELKKFTLIDQANVKHTFMEALLKRALAEPVVMAKLLDKIFVDVTPPPPPTEINVHNTNGQINSENHVAIGKLLSDDRGREVLALLAERLQAGGIFAGGDGVGR